MPGAMRLRCVCDDAVFEAAVVQANAKLTKETPKDVHEAAYRRTMESVERGEPWTELDKEMQPHLASAGETPEETDAVKGIWEDIRPMRRITKPLAEAAIRAGLVVYRHK